MRIGLRVSVFLPEVTSNGEKALPFNNHDFEPWIVTFSSFSRWTEVTLRPPARIIYGSVLFSRGLSPSLPLSSDPELSSTALQWSRTAGQFNSVTRDSVVARGSRNLSRAERVLAASAALLYIPSHEKPSMPFGSIPPAPLMPYREPP